MRASYINDVVVVRSGALYGRTPICSSGRSLRLGKSTVGPEPLARPSMLPVSNLPVASPLIPLTCTHSLGSSRRYMDSSRMCNKAWLTGRIGCGCIVGFSVASMTPSHDGKPHTEGQLNSRPTRAAAGNGLVQCRSDRNAITHLAAHYRRRVLLVVV